MDNFYGSPSGEGLCPATWYVYVGSGLDIESFDINNFSGGSQTNGTSNTFKMGGEHIRERNLSRGGEVSHACMPGCMIECSNVYAGEDGEEISSPVEYETLGIMGTNCGIKDLIPSRTGCSFIKIVIVFPECAFQSNALAALKVNTDDKIINKLISFFIFFLPFKN